MQLTLLHSKPTCFQAMGIDFGAFCCCQLFVKKIEGVLCFQKTQKSTKNFMNDDSAALRARKLKRECAQFDEKLLCAQKL